MPLIRIHCAPRKPAREDDVGFAIQLARSAGLFLHKVTPQTVRLESTRTKETVFIGQVRDAVTYMRGRADA